ncbi:DDE-type integrase/transposase/recombinase [Proteiniclasticum sp. QWL-01]|uniref:DDE-type integrase/transposase/recombinase n=1 Tax=Proteiniclasticum sp. QWL-01 TaxID=3036945 RepID=UPI00240F521A|nr:DDE-type integrase/transposase/recombinase [Proteiniclasticum sp. QWL-01]WFF71808.1 DDE-type integrase/transposase/recombinase [Proteiniclasticum sp. QWL-01]
MKDKEKAQEIATQRAILLAPLLSHDLDKGQIRVLKEQICREAGISERTLRRYLNSYQQKGFSGLIPQARVSQDSRAIPTLVLDEAVRLRKEIPSRSVAEIIRIMEWEGLTEAGAIKRSSLQEKLQEKGYSGKHMAIYAAGGVATRRFQKRTRNKLWHSDIKYGCYLPIGPGNKPQQVYLVAFLDDATRMILHAQFYSNLEQSIVEDCFRKAILKWGIPEQAYFDNGRQFKNKWMSRACAKLGIRLIFAKPYSPEGTGKIEKFNQNIDRFLDEYKFDNSERSLEAMNERFWIWLEECYQNKPHTALNGTTPHQAYNLDPRPLKYLPAEKVANAFLHAETRKVDKSGCINFGGAKYEVGLPYVARSVEVVYDPSNTEELSIEYQDDKPFVVRKLVIGERVAPKPQLPEFLTPVKPTSSRLLDGAQKQNQKRKDKQQSTAISFKDIRKGGGSDV